jgi:ABC-type multidrug transport system fused ATPase/permease subunit
MAKHVRTALYTNLLTKHIGWHDLRENSAGLLTIVLSKDTEALEGAATETSALFLQTIGLTTIALVMGLFFSWRLTLAALIFIPFLCLGINLGAKYAPNAIMPKAKAKESENSADILASDSI